jgi:alanine-glyoxylate transaminase/serine-glyoxylate transaminase/serine-pyruvate transaminase
MAPTSRAAGARVKQIAKHLDSKPFLELNTPFSTERGSRLEDDKGNTIKRQKPQERKPEPRAPAPVQAQPQAQAQAHTQTQSQPQAHNQAPIPAPAPAKKTESVVPKKMSNQQAHPALLIPGPIEFDDAVLESMSHYR